MRATAMLGGFQLGEQPEWAGTEPCKTFDPSFIEQLIQEAPEQQLVTRGYTIVELPADAVSAYSSFHSSFEAFMQQDETEKVKHATVQFERQLKTPNQLHGFSRVSSLKEQYMLRCTGIPNEITSLNEMTTPSVNDFGLHGTSCYENFDWICRDLSHKVLATVHPNLTNFVDEILDPLGERGQPPVLSDDGKHVYSHYVPPGYISSSIMDNFHYLGASLTKSERFHNNHSAHTDSGLLTLVVVTDQPGLEVYDQNEDCWIAIEEVFHEYLERNGDKAKNSLCHRKYATVFWSDSVAYLNHQIAAYGGVFQLKPLFHRVADCAGKERNSVVFKQRTAPMRTACRYQEDYVLASIQMQIDNRTQRVPIPGVSEEALVVKTLVFASVLALGLHVCRYAFGKSA